LERVMSAQQSDFSQIEHVGPVVAASLAAWFADGENCAFVKRLQEHVRIRSLPQLNRETMPLLGKRFVITGTLPSMSRQQAAGHIKLRGGAVSASISKETDYLVAGESPGSKFDKAVALGIPVLDEEAFKKLLAL
jgi:DNA ligase (NAD+)